MNENRRTQFVLPANDGMTVRMAVYPRSWGKIDITVNRFRIEEYTETDNASTPEDTD